jgi:hypothetical protein
MSAEKMDAIDRLEALAKSDDDQAAYMLGYKDARAGKPAKPKKAQKQVDATYEGDQGEGNAADPNADDEGDADADPNADDEGDADADPNAAAPPGEEGDGDPNGDPDADPNAEEDVDGDPNADPDDPELPADDGDNHGVGDLDGDGQVDSLLAEVTNLEKMYYAAVGLHGTAHHKAAKALDIYHRAVRKLARALAGEGPPGDAPVEGEQGDGPPKGEKPPPGRDEDGDGDSDSVEQSSNDDDQGGGNDDDQGGGNDDDQGGGNDDEKEKPKKKPPFGKSSAYRDLLTNDPLARGAEGLRVLHPGPEPVRLIDDRVDPSALFRKSQARSVAFSGGRHAPVTVTVDAKCPLHGHDHESIYKSQVLATPHLRCTCTR